DYINLHGTATPANDAMEATAVSGVFGTDVPGSSTKGWTGHTLGAAGITEAVVSALVIQHGFAPANLNLMDKDSKVSAHILDKPLETNINAVLTNSFGFGGSNACLILEAADG
ncbi:MAG: beta-ketoacyl-[acyl-carrier-protein] synthase II, partial [Gammaproteobacteria bacterium]